MLALPFLALAACGEEPASEPVATETVQREPVQTLPAPDEELFSQVFAEACKAAEPVNVASCGRAMGGETASCEYGLGDDEYLRHEATIEANEDNTGWKLADAEAVCAEHDA